MSRAKTLTVQPYQDDTSTDETVYATRSIGSVDALVAAARSWLTVPDGVRLEVLDALPPAGGVGGSRFKGPFK